MPGYTKTDINAKLLDDPEIRNFATNSSVFGRIGQVEDIADAVAFLASSDSRWVTGQILDVSVGFVYRVTTHSHQANLVIYRKIGILKKSIKT